GEELNASERALVQLGTERESATGRLTEAEAKLADAQRERGRLEVAADSLAASEADVRDLVRAGEAQAVAVERERTELIARRERLAADRDAAKAATAAALASFTATQRDERMAVDAPAATTKRAEDARLDAATSEELRGERSKVGVEEERASGALKLLEEQVRAELGLPEDEPLPDPESIEIDEEPTEQEKANALRDLQRLRRKLIALEPVNPLAATE